jgi:hypothetical protein
LERGTKHVIAEAPNAPICTANATALRKKQMRMRGRPCASAHELVSSGSPSGTTSSIRRV